MIKGKGFEMLIASPSEYKELVAEIYYEGKFVALVSQESHEIFNLETPPANLVEEQINRKINWEGFQAIVEEACKRLKN